MIHDDSKTEGAGSKARRGLWSRLRRLGLLQGADLIRIHRIAQQQRVTPEVAAIALGVVTRKQVLEG
jgi:hypothetical protein